MAACADDEYRDPATGQCLKKQPIPLIDPVKVIGDFVKGVLLDLGLVLGVVYVGYRVLTKDE